MTRMKVVHQSSILEIVFLSSDLEGVILRHDDPIVISTVMVNAEVKRVLVDRGSSVDIIFLDAFNKLALRNSNLQTYKEELIGFYRDKIYLDEYIMAHLTLLTQPKT